MSREEDMKNFLRFGDVIESATGEAFVVTWVRNEYRDGEREEGDTDVTIMNRDGEILELTFEDIGYVKYHGNSFDMVR